MPDNFDNEQRQRAPVDQTSGPDYTVDSREWRRRQRRRWRQDPGSRLFIAILLIAVGILLFLDNIGILPIRHIWDFWPLILVGVGLSKLACRTASQILLGIFLILFGALFLLLTLHIIAIRTWDGTWPLSLLLIAFGFLALVKAVESGSANRPRIGFPGQPSGLAENFLDEHSVFGSVKRRLDTTDFRGGKIQSVFGSVEIDLRYVQLPANEKSVTIDVDSVFGSTKIRIPDTWQLSIRAAAVLGNIEDKTLPTRTTAGAQPPILIITGQSVFGSIELEN